MFIIALLREKFNWLGSLIVAEFLDVVSIDGFSLVAIGLYFLRRGAHLIGDVSLRRL